MKQAATAKDYMTADVITIDPDTDIHAAIKVLTENRVSGAPVVDDDGNITGILSTKDCLKIAFSASYHQDSGGSVRDYMSDNVETIDADTDIVTVAGVFLKSRFRRFPITRDDRLVGLISRCDVLRALEDLW